MCIVCQRHCSTPLCWTSRRWLVGEILLDPEKVPCFSAETQWSPCLAGLGALEMGLVVITCLVALYLRRGFYKCPGIDWLGYIAFRLSRVCVSVHMHAIMWLASEVSDLSLGSGYMMLCQALLGCEKVSLTIWCLYWNSLQPYSTEECARPRANHMSCLMAITGLGGLCHFGKWTNRRENAMKNPRKKTIEIKTMRRKTCWDECRLQRWLKYK